MQFLKHVFIQKYVHKDKKKAANFLLGVLMYYDCLSICEFKKTEALEEVQFVIAGKRIIAQAVYDILTDIMQEKKVHLLDEDELMAAKGHFVSQNYIINGRKVSRMMSDLKDRLLEEKLIVILRGLAEEKLIATVDILKNMGMHFFELAIDNESELSMEKSLRNIEGLRKHYGDSIHIGAGTVINKLQVKGLQRSEESTLFLRI